MKAQMKHTCDGIIDVECFGGGADTGFVIMATGPVPIAVNCGQSNIILHSQTKESTEE